MMNRRASGSLVLATILLLATTALSGNKGSSLLHDPSGTIIVSNMNDNTATIIDVGTGRVLATLATGEGPHEVATSHSGRWAVVSNYGVRARPGHSLTVIDVEHLQVVRTIDIGTYLRPHGMAFFPGDTILAVTAQGNQAVLLVDMRKDSVVSVVPSGGRTSHMLALTPSGNRLITANIPDGTVSILDPLHGAPARVMKAAKSDEGVSISPDGRTAWVGSNSDSVVVVVDLESSAITDTLRGFGMAYRLAVSRDSRFAVITDPVRGEIRIVDARTRKQSHVIAVPRDSIVATAEVPGSPSPEGVIISNDSHYAFVTLQGRNRVITIELESGKILRYTPTGVWSDGIAYSSFVHR